MFHEAVAVSVRARRRRQRYGTEGLLTPLTKVRRAAYLGDIQNA
jgi:hypothetical protein